MFNGVELFKKLSFGKKIRLSVVAIILGIMVLAPMVAAAGNPNPGVVPVNSNFHGKTYGEWSAEWWKWVYSIPADRNPLLDKTGKFTTEAQSGDVYFLAGSWAGTEEINCKVPVGKAIFFPIINSEASFVEEIYGDTEDELRASVKNDIDKVTVKEVTVDRKSLKDLDNYRVGSDFFVFNLPEQNVLGKSSGPSRAVSDGYWIMLTPLSAGKHTISIYGIAEHALPDGSDFVAKMTYNLEVQPKSQMKR